MAKILDNIQKAIFQVKSLIQGNLEVRKLVYYDTPDALSQSEVNASIANTKEHFTVSPIFDVTEPPFDKNTIISVVFNKGTYDDETVKINGLLKINILTRSGLWELNDNKIRPLEISNLIIDIINNQKTDPSHKLVFSNMELAILNEDVNGFALTFLLVEGSGFDGEF